MSAWLERVGKIMFRHKWFVIASWVVVVGIVGALAMHFYKAPSNAISIPGTEAQQAIDRLGELFPDAGKGSARIVFASKDATLLADHQQAIERFNAELSQVKGVSQVISPFTYPAAMSTDKTVAYSTIQLNEASDSVAEDTRQVIDDKVASLRSPSLDVEISGDLIDKAPGEILGIGEVVGVVIALVVLVITLGSLVAAGLPIVIALVTIAVGAAALFATSQIVDITATTPVLAIMLGLAVGIDYSLFIVNKYRYYLLHGYSYEESAGRAVATAGNAVVFAALTVVIALSALSIVQIPFMTTMGLAGAATVGLAALVAITLLPALLAVVSSRIVGRKLRTKIAAAQLRGAKDEHRIERKTFGNRLGEMIARRPWTVLTTAILVIAVVALPVFSLKLGLPTDQYAAKTTTQRKAYDLLEDKFGAGFNGPLIVIADDVPVPTDTEQAKVRALLEAQYKEQSEKVARETTAAFEARASQVKNPEEAAQLASDIHTAQQQAIEQEAAARVQLEEKISQYGSLYQLNLVAQKISSRDDVAEAMPVMVTDDMKTGVIQVIPKTSPSDPATITLIEELRDETSVHQLTGNNQLSFAVTGSTAIENDINEKLAAALPAYLTVVVGLSLILLVIVFRSVLVPLKATIGFLLSVAAMFGALVAVFQWGWFGIADAPGPIVSFIPIIATGVLFGLAMDYEFFLVSSIHEEYKRVGNAKKAVVNGFSVGSRVVIAAGMIMVAVFVGFVTNHDATIQAIGFGLAVGILVDAFIVRLLIVPAVLVILGKSAWWLPSWLDRIVPHVSIEGDDSPGKR